MKAFWTAIVATPLLVGSATVTLADDHKKDKKEDHKDKKGDHKEKKGH